MELFAVGHGVRTSLLFTVGQWLMLQVAGIISTGMTVNSIPKARTASQEQRSERKTSTSTRPA